MPRASIVRTLETSVLAQFQVSKASSSEESSMKGLPISEIASVRLFTCFLKTSCIVIPVHAACKC